LSTAALTIRFFLAAVVILLAWRLTTALLGLVLAGRAPGGEKGTVT
jgi:hypothetical protein